MTDKKLTSAQFDQALDFVNTYGIEAEDIIYFNDKPDPFFSYEAVGVLCNQLTDLQDICIDPAASPFVDSVAVRCTLKTENRTSSSIGIANINEKIRGEELNELQVLGLASARAIRNALKIAGIDLVKAHYKAKETGEATTIAADQESTRSKLLAQAHIAGAAAGLIQNKDKSLWRKFLENRYGVESSQHLSEQSLNDLVAVLNTMKPINPAEINRTLTESFNRGFSERAV